MALAAALLLLTMPALWNFAAQGMADLPLAAFLLAGGGLVARWLERPGRLRELVLGALLMALGVWVKREGLMVWLAAGLAIGLWASLATLRTSRLRWRPVLCYLAPAIVLLPWLADLNLHHVVDRNYVRPSLGWLVEHGDRLPVLAHALGAQLVAVTSWGVVWVLLAAALLLNPPLRSAGRAFLLWVLAAHLVSVLLIYTFSTWIPYTDHVASSIDRLVLQVLPLALLLLALSVPRLRGSERLEWPVGPQPTPLRVREEDPTGRPANLGRSRR
jgi:4-amino-4-deoxy-L-arabinose transferase-like glycosyltransferase